MRENPPMLRCPWGSTMNAAMSGPIAVPTFPPTWKNDCASPCRPPDAILATRDDSGWKTDDPIPTSAAARRREEKLRATERRRSPARVLAIPIASEYGIGRRSV